MVASVDFYNWCQFAITIGLIWELQFASVGNYNLPQLAITINSVGYYSCLSWLLQLAQITAWNIMGLGHTTLKTIIALRHIN